MENESKEAYEKGSQQKALSTAQNFIKMGLTLEQVAQGTELSLEEVKKLAQTVDARRASN